MDGWSAGEAKARGADGVLRLSPWGLRLFRRFGFLVRATVGFFVPQKHSTRPADLVVGLEVGGWSWHVLAAEKGTLQGLRNKLFQNYLYFLLVPEFATTTTHRCLCSMDPTHFFCTLVLCVSQMCTPKVCRSKNTSRWSVHLTFGAGGQHHRTSLWARHTVGPVYRWVRWDGRAFVDLDGWFVGAACRADIFKFWNGERQRCRWARSLLAVATSLWC